MSLDSAFISILNSQLSTPFDAIGVAAIGPIEDEMRHLELWLEKGYAGDIRYMHNNLHLRANPKELLPEARSMIMVLMNYYPRRWQPADKPQIAAYAYGNDYHHIVKSKLSQLAEEINKVAPHSYAVFCDSAPVLERYWAMRAGLGWIGRNRQLIIPGKGSYFFLGELLIDIELEYDTPFTGNHCGNCHLCIDNCPGRALSNNGLNANHCLSYLTIEHRDNLPQNIGEIMGKNFYGCDRCQTVCPHNRFATPNNTPELQPCTELLQMTPEKWRVLSKEQYDTLFSGSAVERCGYEQLLRNIAASRLNKTDK